MYEDDNRGTAKGDAMPRKWSDADGSVTLVVGEPSLLVPAREAVLRVLDEVDAACGPHRADCELTRLNNAHGRTVHVTSLFLEILLAARRVAELTGGLVDPTGTGGWRAVRADRQAHTV